MTPAETRLLKLQLHCPNGFVGCAAAPSGASTGKYEAHELRDGDEKRYMGKGVLSAVENVNGKIFPELRGMECENALVDSRMIRLDDTENKKRLGANAILSLACAKAAASHAKMPLYRYIGGTSGVTLPVPMMNILNGGAHAANNIDIQEFMIMPIGFGTSSEALRAGCEIYHTLGRILKKDGHETTVGDEGGFAPNLKSHTEALDYIIAANKRKRIRGSGENSSRRGGKRMGRRRQIHSAEVGKTVRFSLANKRMAGALRKISDNLNRRRSRRR